MAIFMVGCVGFAWFWQNDNFETDFKAIYSEPPKGAWVRKGGEFCHEDAPLAHKVQGESIRCTLWHF